MHGTHTRSQNHSFSGLLTGIRGAEEKKPGVERISMPLRETWESDGNQGWKDGVPGSQAPRESRKEEGNTGNKKAKNFSLGMRQRLGIAVALAGSPDFLVLDEPVNGLDPQGIIEIRELILKLNQEHGITVLISSHILDELSKLATYYGFIDNGKMIKQISSIELESKCRKCTHLKVSSTKTLAYVLDTMNIEYKILSNTEADIFEKVNISKLTTELSKKDCEVISIHEHDESLESYFVSLVGGARHE